MIKRVLVTIGLCMILAGVSFAASGNTMYHGVISSTGTTGVACDRRANEVYVVTYDTHPAYVNYTSSTTVATTDFRIEAVNNGTQIEPTWYRMDIETSNFGIRIDTMTESIRYYYKTW